MTTSFAGWFRAQRARSGLTQAALAGRVGRTQTWVSQVERGEVRPNADEALAYHADGNVLDALDEGGYLSEPPWVRRIEARLDGIEKALRSA